mgnify:CR=1 FL=1
MKLHSPIPPKKARIEIIPLIDVHAHWGPWFFSMDVGSVSVNSDLMDRFGIDIQLVSAIEAMGSAGEGEADGPKHIAARLAVKIFGAVVLGVAR